MKQSLYFRNFLAIALIVFISFSLLGVLSSAWNYRRQVSEKRARMTLTLQETARYVTVQYVYSGVDLGGLSLSMWLSFTSGVSGFDLLVTDADGVVGACSGRTFQHFGMQVPQSSLQSASAGGYNVRLTTMGQIYPEVRRIVGVPLTRMIGGEQIIFGYLFVSSDMIAFANEWQAFSGVFILIALSVMALTFAISFLVTKKMAEPLKEMVGAARRFARGDFSVRIASSSRQDEIGQLTQAFNAMADSLESSETFRRDFIANLSHELKTPMTVISGFAEGMHDGTIPPEKKQRYLDVIVSESQRLSRLVKGMMEMSSIQTAKSDSILDSSFDITEVVRLALLSLGGKIEGRRLDVEANFPEEAIMTRGDSDAITQVAYNLIDNAIKFSEPGGVLGLELWKQGGLAYVSVENHGETIGDDDLPHIFDRFHKADKSRSFDKSGVGLGLYIVKTILDNHNQDIFVESRGGVTKFIFTLAIAPPAQQAKQGAVAREHGPGSKPRSAL
ncbi:MAG: HAMP domain-containing histidine kinase [Oscillospiraceae bacterium]|nr:HAMP domain-containing histidine kinase [Oscillospiraceae bacterium]